MPASETRAAEPAPARVLIVGSAPVTAAFLRALASRADIIVCADGGADATLSAELVPVVVLGDMDSIGFDTKSRLAGAGVEVQTHPPEKDKTDLELALDYALALHPTSITIAGALGGARLDHTIGNLLLLTLPSLDGIDTRIEDEGGVAFVVMHSRQVSGACGDYISLLPLTARVEGVVTHGLRYALDGETLVRGSTRGVSNELIGTQASIAISKGMLLVRHERTNAPLADC